VALMAGPDAAVIGYPPHLGPRFATGVWPDMTEHGAASDAWPELYEKVLAGEILVVAGPIWLGDSGSVAKRVIERLYACSHLLNDAGQYAYYGRAGACAWRTRLVLAFCPWSLPRR
jgi:multimeric flavodoxin WrbA